MKTKNYKITFCLGAGYDGTGKNYSPEFAEQVIEQWMTERIEQGLPTVSGVITFGKLFFPAKDRRKDGKQVTVADTGVYAGGWFSKPNEDRTDEEVRDTLTSLATAIKNQLEQERVYILYEDDTWFV